jgi:hypothetical protein
MQLYIIIYFRIIDNKAEDTSFEHKIVRVANAIERLIGILLK